jgi:alpha-L-glutamate ligase-like protein
MTPPLSGMDLRQSDSTGARTPSSGGAGSRLAALRAKLAARVVAFGPLVAIALALSGAGWLVEQYVGPGAFDGARLFFQVVLAGVLMAVLRNEIGLRTYGLFAPVVIAFVMTAAGPLWGLVLFVNVLAVTLVSHRALQPLRLGTAPRVAVLLGVAAVTTAIVIALSGVGGLPAVYAAGGVFFPTIISAWYADRAATEVEERGWTEPAKRLLGTLVAVVLAYAVISNVQLVDWFIGTPVAWGLVLLAVAVVGSRSGLRLSELRRFRGHYDGQLGSLSVALARVRYRLREAGRQVTAALGRDLPELPPEEEVLGMKRRNKYIETYNPPHLRPGADQKASINRRLAGLGIPSPRTYAVIDSPGDLEAAERAIDARDEFVLKPSRGYGGEGIVVVSGRDGDRYDTSKGLMTGRELRDHVRRIVDGHYSGLEANGSAIIEERLTPAPFMRKLHGDGVADVRVIVFQGYPVMAMTRLPTTASGGAANLHLGAVGVGLSVTAGRPLSAYQQSRDRELDTHPDTGASLTDFRVPNWDTVLETAVEAAAASGLGYTGVDVVLTEGNEPKVLEVNVRPGLGIQNTTGAGLFQRLAFVEALPPEYEFLSANRKIELARKWDDADFAETALPDAEELAAETGVVSTDVKPSRELPSPAAIGDEADRPLLDDKPGTGGSKPGEAKTLTARGLLRRRLRTGGGMAASGALLAGAWSVGLPVLVVLFVLNAIGFVGWICARAVGLQGTDWGEPA